MRMQVGDSFFIPTLDPSALSRTIHWEAKRLGVTVTCREAMNQEVLGLRTWRVKDKVDTPKDG